MSLVLCCRDATEALTAEAEGALTGMPKATLALHLTVCGRCRSYKQQFGTTVEVLRAMRAQAQPKEEAPPEAVDAILRRIAEAEPDE